MKVGFWSKKHRPQPYVWRNKQKRYYFLQQLEDLENYLALRHRIVHYKGWSTCRICNIQNGSREFHYKQYRWPSGYYHYIAKHKVKPPQRFRRFVCEQAKVARQKIQKIQEGPYKMAL